MTVLGLDVGTVRVGVASSDESEVLASPLATLARRNEAKLWERLQQEIATRNVKVVVVGLPRKLDGSEGTSTEMAREFARSVEQRFPVAVAFWDERFTSAAAERSLIDSGMRRAKRRKVTDEVAACIMLQSWLDAEGRGRS